MITQKNNRKREKVSVFHNIVQKKTKKNKKNKQNYRQKKKPYVKKMK